MEDKEIFQGYEIGKWEFGPRIYKIIAASTVLTLLPLIGLGQTNLLSASACDSPFVGTVCEVLDTVYAGTKILAKNTGYFDGEYTDVQLREENEIVWMNETDVEPKLDYPEGYFEIANRDELAALRALEKPDSGFVSIPPSLPPVTPIAPPTPKYRAPRARNRGSKKPIYPKNGGKVLDGEIGDDPIGDLLAGNKGDKDKNEDNKKPGTDKTPETEKTPDGTAKKPKNPLDEHTAVRSDPLNDKPINRKPLYDVADITLERVEAKQVDLAKGFIVRMNGVVSPDGMLDEEKSGWGKAEGDEPMIELAKIAVSKVGVSGWLKYLSDKDANQLNIMFGQNDEQMVADVRSDLKDENKAKSTASALRGLIQGAILLDKNGMKDMQDDEIALLKAATVTNEGRILIIKFNIDKKLGQEIIAARLAEYKQKKAEEARKKASGDKPSGSLKKPLGDANAGR